MSIDPFLNSEQLSQWTANVLIDAHIGEIRNWQMLEYWMQVELYRAVESGRAGAWRHLGYYEQNYYTDIPLPGKKTKVKFIDLVFASPERDNADRIIWIELKDLGRNPNRLVQNAKGVGRDLAALYRLDPVKTKEIWLDTPKQFVNAGRTEEWIRFAPALDARSHLIGQIVIMPEAMVNDVSPDLVIQNWLGMFEVRTRVGKDDYQIIISDSRAQGFVILALVAPLPVREKL